MEKQGISDIINCVISLRRLLARVEFKIIFSNKHNSELVVTICTGII